MGYTAISDVIVPEVFSPYVIEQTAKRFEFWGGGLVGRDEKFDELARSGGTTLQMPFWKDLSGNSESLETDTALTVNAITTGKDIAVLLARGKAWGTEDLAKALSGDDPAGAIGNLVADWWARDNQDTLLSIMAGVFADNDANDSGDMTADISTATASAAVAANKIGPHAIVAARKTMGDRAGRLTAIAMHSDVYHDLTLQKKIVTHTVDSSDVGINTSRDEDSSLEIATYLGLRVIVDDSMPTIAITGGNAYVCYLFGRGAVAFGQGNAPVPTEVDRNSLKGQDVLINRSHFILHPRGVKWTSPSLAGDFAVNTELDDAASWDRVYERKNVRLARLIVNI